MDIAESNPERRNLILMCMAIVIFYVGVGHVGNDSALTLPLVNLKFDNPRGLGLLAWIANLYFLFRYWVSNQKDMSKDIRQELSGEWRCIGARFIVGRIRRRMKAIAMDDKDAVEDNVFHVVIDHSSLRFSLRYMSTVNNGNTFSGAVKMSREFEFFTLAYCYTYGFFLKNSVSKHLGPYLLFVFSLCLAVANSLPCYWNYFCSKFTFLMFS